MLPSVAGFPGHEGVVSVAALRGWPVFRLLSGVNAGAGANGHFRFPQTISPTPIANVWPRTALLWRAVIGEFRPHRLDDEIDERRRRVEVKLAV